VRSEERVIPSLKSNTKTKDKSSTKITANFKPDDSFLNGSLSNILDDYSNKDPITNLNLSTPHYIKLMAKKAKDK
jgi:hypothetical protein